MPGSGWTGAEIIDTQSGWYYPRNPRIAFDSSGNGTVVYCKGETCWRTYAHRYAPGAGWSGAELIDVGPSNDNSGNPQISFSPDGSAIAVFIQSDDFGSRIYANKYLPYPVYPIRVNFQNESAAIPVGFMMDYGDVYGRYGFQGYGWR